MSNEWRELPVKRADFADGVMTFEATFDESINVVLPFMADPAGAGFLVTGSDCSVVFPPERVAEVVARAVHNGGRLPVTMVSVSPPRAYAKPINRWEAFKERRYPRWLKAVFPVRTREWWEVRYHMVATPKSNDE